jgi:hypothetical protein
MRGKSIFALIVLTALLASILAPPAMAVELSEVLKVGGIALAVKVFGNQLNSFINGLLGARGVDWEGATKVVPILSVGTGGFIGAAQVVGPSDRVGRVQAVLQGELNLSGQDIRFRYLQPIASRSTTGSSVQGVGVSSVIDFEF